MEITLRALITEVHGMLFGAFFQMAVYSLVVELRHSAFVEQPPKLTPQGYARERLYLICMVGLGWAAVLTGAYLIYPWYRAVPPAGLTDLSEYPRTLLLSSGKTSEWHNIGMEWKEHVAWLAPMAITMVAYVTMKYGRSLTRPRQLRKAVLGFALAAFVATGVAGAFGAFLNKYAPVRGGSTIVLIGGGGAGE